MQFFLGYAVGLAVALIMIKLPEYGVPDWAAVVIGIGFYIICRMIVFIVEMYQKHFAD